MKTTRIDLQQIKVLDHKGSTLYYVDQMNTRIKKIIESTIKQLKNLNQEFHYAIMCSQKTILQFAFESKDEFRFRRQELSARIKENTNGKYT